MIVQIPKVPYETVDDIMGSYELDLIAFFRVLHDDVMKVVEESGDKSPDDIIHEIERLFNE